MTDGGLSNRLQKIRELMREKDVDGILLRKRRNFSWLTGGRSNFIVHTTECGVADIVVFENEIVCITTKMEAARIREEELHEFDCQWITPEWYEGVDGAIAELCQGKRLGCDVVPSTASLPVGIDLSREIAELTYVLEDDEMEKYRWLGQTAARALETTCREIQPGMTEFEIQAHLASQVIRHGIQPHVMLVATDDRIYRYRHPIPTEKKLEKYAMLVLCAERWGLVANATRFVHFGCLPKELEENKQKLAQIDLTMNLATRPGVPIKDVFATGIESYRRLGFAEDWRYLHQGGPTGYATREFLATPDCPGVVHLHQAFSWNPAIRGIKSEDTILVGPEENEFLTCTGEWPYIIMEQNEKAYRRPDILIR